MWNFLTKKKEIPVAPLPVSIPRSLPSFEEMEKHLNGMGFVVVDKTKFHESYKLKRKLEGFKSKLFKILKNKQPSKKSLKTQLFELLEQFADPTPTPSSNTMKIHRHYGEPL